MHRVRVTESEPGEAGEGEGQSSKPMCSEWEMEYFLQWKEFTHADST
jgi:hypothetical protein